MMLKQITAFIAALLVPFLLFILVISLNESTMEKNESADKKAKFEVSQQKQLNQPVPEKKPEPRRRESTPDMPSVKPSDMGDSLSGSGLSFGIPQFDEANFSDINDSGLLDSVAGKAMDKETVDTPPKVLRRSPVVYPDLARRQGVSGYVTLNVLIDESGNVEDVEIIESKPREIFDLRASDTIRRWKFEPATYNGKKVKVWAMQKIVFKLD